MTAIVIEGVPPWDGRYEFPDFTFTNRELFRIKEICGIRAGELIDALDANDTGAYVAVAAVVMDRTGMRVDMDDLWNGPVGSIMLDLRAADDADPPTPIAVEGEPSESVSSSGSGSGSDGG